MIGDLCRDNNVERKWRGKTIESPLEEKPPEDDVRRRFSIDADVLKNIQHKHGPRKKMSKIEPTVENYCVRKFKPKENVMKTVIVMKPVNSDSQVTLRPMEFVINYTGPRFTGDGKFISHSILGSLEDFESEAKRRGENLHLLKTNPSAGDSKKTSQTLKGCNSLKKWNSGIEEWNKAQKYLSSKLQRPIEDLLMRTANIYPAWVDSRVETFEALQATVSGYGMSVGQSVGEKRVNSQFWKQHSKCGHDDETAIWTTLNQSETGNCCPKEFRQVPDQINLEKDKGKIILERSYKPYYTDYLNQQRENVKDVIHILNPHHPDLADLMVKGKGQSQKPTVPSIQEETGQGHITLHRTVSMTEFSNLESENDSFKGPALAIGQQILTWKKLPGENPIRPLTLTFRSGLGQIQIKKIPMKNCGSTHVRYYWEKVPVENPFGFVKRRLQQYYFFTEGGILPPGGDIQLPVMFKSVFPGNFKERWKLKTRPVLCGGADILINFRGIACEPMLHLDRVAEIEKKMMQRERTNIINASIQSITSSIMTPERLSPIVTYLTPEEEFSQSYPGLFYHSGKLQEMEVLYDTVCNCDLMTTKPEESFTVHNMTQSICMLDSMELPSEDHDHYTEILEQKYDKQLEFTNEYTALTTDMSFKHLVPYNNLNLQHNFICQQVLHDMIESFTHSAYIMTYKTGFPVTPLEPEETNEEKIDKKNKRRNSIPPKNKKGNDQKNNLSPSHGKHMSSSASRNRKKGAGSPQKDVLPVPTPLPPQHLELESFSPLLETASPKQLSSYREKLYIQGYSILQEAIDRIESIFIDLEETSHRQM
ncbi:MYCBP-associated protein-like isoform X3 [Mytilus galloprovincialis]|uniref:MYCBP-associated protein-like isoform X3 n=1 Tax=Mytilus galloprovincialis TaxID=29158 RepID=UPI003F7BB4EF